MPVELFFKVKAGSGEIIIEKYTSAGWTILGRTSTSTWCTVEYGDTLRITANPASGYEFDKTCWWHIIERTYNCTTMNPYTFGVAYGLDGFEVYFRTKPVKTRTVTLNLSKTTAIVGETIEATGRVTEDGVGVITQLGLSVNNVYYTNFWTDQNGYYKKSFSIDKPGEYEVTVTDLTTYVSAKARISVVEVAPEYKITLKVEPSAVQVNQKVKLSGWIYKITYLGYEGIPNTTVKIIIRNGWSYETSLTTNSRGEYSVEVTPTKAGNYTVTATAIDLAGAPTAYATFTVTEIPVAVEVGSITISKKEPAGNPTIGQRVVFSGYVRDTKGNPVANQKVTVAEKDLLGQLWPLKNSKGNYIFTTTNSSGYFELVDDDGWPDMGYKTVWAVTNKKIGGDLYVSPTVGLYTEYISGVTLKNFVMSEALSINVVGTEAVTWNYELRIYFLKLPWATESKVKEAIPSFAAAANPFIEPLGYEYVGGYLNWANSFIALCYKGKSPALPLKAIIAAIVAIAITVGIVIISTQWCSVQEKKLEVLEQQARAELELKEELLNLYKQGMISYDQLLELFEKAKISTGITPGAPECTVLGIPVPGIPAEFCGLLNLAVIGGGGLILLALILSLLRR
ncbi:MAG: Ig-like domain-containing protein [Fervidicoccaceae archaeon]